MLRICICLFLLIAYAPVSLRAQHAALSSGSIRSWLDSTRSLPLAGGRRTAACYEMLWYDFRVARTATVEWMYGELIIPGGTVVPYSYYCLLSADGFYAGLQQKREGRQFIFSVWDAGGGKNNAAKMPADSQAVLLQAGHSVLLGRFGGEGSGVQTRWLFNWQTDSAYKLLTHLQCDTVAQTTTITLFFHDGQRWKMIAKVRRPHFISTTKGYASFLEDWSGRGDRRRRAVFYRQQWVRTTDGVWKQPAYAMVMNYTKKKVFNYGAVSCTDGGYFLVTGAGFTNFYAPDKTRLPYLGGGSPPVAVLPE